MNYEQLTRYQLFEHIEPDKLKAMFECLNYQEKHFDAGSIIRLNESNRLIGVIVKGSVSLIAEDVWGTESLFAVAGEGEVIGETFVCRNDGNDIITFVAQTDCDVIMIDYAKVFHTCRVTCPFHHRLIENMVSVIASKNYSLMTKSSVVSQHTLRRKIMMFLSNQAKINGANTFTVPINRKQMADYLATDRSALSRELSKMKAENIIDFEKNTFHVNI